MNGKRWKKAQSQRRDREASCGLGASCPQNEILEIYTAKKSYAKNLLKEAAAAMSLGRAGINETPLRDVLGLLREIQHMLVPGRMLRKAIRAGRADDWSELLESDEVNSLNDGEAEGELPRGEAGGR